MDIHQKKALQKNQASLCDDLVLDTDLEANIVQHSLFTEAQLDEIKAENSRKGQIRKMLKILIRRGPRAFDTFIICIQDNYCWLADKLRKSYQEEVKNITNENINEDITDVSQEEIARLQKELQLKDMLIQKQSVEIQYLNSKITAYEEKIEQLQKELQRKARIIENQSKEIQNLKQKSEEEKAQLENELHMKATAIHEQNAKIQSLDSKIKASQEEIARLQKGLQQKPNIVQEQSEITQNRNAKLKISEEEITQLQKELQQKCRFIQEQIEKIQNLNSKCNYLDMTCKQLEQNNSYHQQNTHSERVFVHEKDPDNDIRLPSINPQKHISQQKKQTKNKLQTFRVGIGLRGLPSSHRTWRPC